jgi:hypothetical protein
MPRTRVLLLLGLFVFPREDQYLRHHHGIQGPTTMTFKLYRMITLLKIRMMPTATHKTMTGVFLAWLISP